MDVNSTLLIRCMSNLRPEYDDFWKWRYCPQISMRRGLDKVLGEWQWVSLAWNIRRMAVLKVAMAE